MALVATTEHSHLHLVFQQSHQILHVGCLSRTTHGDITHGDDWHIKRLTLQDTCIKQEIPEAHAKAV